MSRATTTATRPAVGVAGLPAEEVALEESAAVLQKVMRRRADGSWHAMTCRERHVNSRVYPCAEGCVIAQDMLKRAREVVRRREDAHFLATLDARLGRIRAAFERKRRPPAEQQAGLWESAG